MTIQNHLSRLWDEFIAYLLGGLAKRHRKKFPPMAVFAHDFIGVQISVFGKYELDELQLVEPKLASLDKDVMVLDIGANIGNHTRFFADVGFKDIHSFEPNPTARSLLEINTRSLNSVTIHPYGLSNTNRKSKAYIPEGNLGGASVQKEAVPGGEVIAFELKKYDALDLSKNKIGLVKIDVEGHEAETFLGMRKALQRDKPLILFECNRRSEKEAANRALNQLYELGYSEFEAVISNTSLVSSKIPVLIRRPAKILERLITPSLGKCKLVSIQQFEDINYPMVLAHPAKITDL